MKRSHENNCDDQVVQYIMEDKLMYGFNASIMHIENLNKSYFKGSFSSLVKGIFDELNNIVNEYYKNYTLYSQIMMNDRNNSISNYSIKLRADIITNQNEQTRLDRLIINAKTEEERDFIEYYKGNKPRILFSCIVELFVQYLNVYCNMGGAISFNNDDYKIIIHTQELFNSFEELAYEMKMLEQI